MRLLDDNHRTFVKPRRLCGWKAAYTKLLQSHNRVWVHVSLGSVDTYVIDDVNLEYALNAEVGTRIRGCVYMLDAMYALSADRRTLEFVEHHPGFRPVVENRRAVDDIPWEINWIDDGFAYTAAREAYLANLL